MTHDNITPILGYSNNGTIDVNSAMPDNMRYWMDGFAEETRHEQPESKIKLAKACWDALKHGGAMLGAGSSRLLETALWDQTSPYNDLCPLIDGRRCVTGCVATAMAIVLRYHRWPVRGTGTISGYQYFESGHYFYLEGYQLGHDYDWGNMPLVYDKSSSSQERTAVATLMRDCGYMVEMQYGTSSSGAYGEKILPALQRHMSFLPYGKYEQRQFYSIAEWVSKLEREIDDNRPVIYTASSPANGGHAFVLDGFDENDYFHINWGWGGVSNGYFRCPDFDEFTKGHAAIFGLQPDGESNYDMQVFLVKGAGVNGIQTEATSFEANSPFDVSFALESTMPVSSTMQIGIGLYNRGGQLKAIVSKHEEHVFPEGTATFVGSMSVQLESDPQIGEYLRLCLIDPGEAAWKPIPAKSGSGAQAILPIADSQMISEYTSIHYDIGSSSMAIITHQGVSYTLYDSQNQIASQGVVEEEKAVIDLNSFPSGIYTLKLSKGTEEKVLVIAL